MFIGNVLGNVIHIVNKSNKLTIFFFDLSIDVASGSGITQCNKIDKPLVVLRLVRNEMTSIITLRKDGKILKFSRQNCDFN